MITRMKEGHSTAPEDEAEQSLTPMDFSTFVLSLASTAMVNLGLVEQGLVIALTPGPDEGAGELLLIAVLISLA